MRSKHSPIRRCIVCGTRAPQRELVRVVRTPEAQVLVDETFKRAGRGAYLCRNPECWSKLAKGSRLSHALRAEVGEESRALLNTYAESIAVQSH